MVVVLVVVRGGSLRPPRQPGSVATGAAGFGPEIRRAPVRPLHQEGIRLLEEAVAVASASGTLEPDDHVVVVVASRSMMSQDEGDRGGPIEPVPDSPRRCLPTARVFSSGPWPWPARAASSSPTRPGRARGLHPPQT